MINKNIFLWKFNILADCLKTFYLLIKYLILINLVSFHKKENKFFRRIEDIQDILDEINDVKCSLSYNLRWLEMKKLNLNWKIYDKQSNFNGKNRQQEI